MRAATRKTLTAGVARIYEPGVKFDSILVLNGPQGIGKSTFFARLGKKWYSDSLTIADMKDKTAPEKLQGYWLLEISELAGMKKMDVETVKSFITRTDDKYRQSYVIGMKEPVSVNVNCFGTETVAEKELAQLAQRQYDLTPAGIIKALHLKAVDYNKTAAYGHFGKPGLPWEQ